MKNAMLKTELNTFDQSRYFKSRRQ